MPGAAPPLEAPTTEGPAPGSAHAGVPASGTDWREGVTPVTGFVDRRKSAAGAAPEQERRQFTNSYHELTPEAGELARAIDAYKLRCRRRFISYEEMLQVVKSLGYRR